MYPAPKDMAAFERACNGSPAFHRTAEIHFLSLAVLQACAGSPRGQEALSHARKISNGGAPVIMIAEEDVVSF